MVRLRSLNRSVADKFVRSIASLPEVTECCSISGEYDYMLKITVPDMKTYKEFVLNQLGHLDVVGGIVSHFVMDVVKNDPELPLHC